MRRRGHGRLCRSHSSTDAVTSPPHSSLDVSARRFLGSSHFPLYRLVTILPRGGERDRASVPTHRTRPRRRIIVPLTRYCPPWRHAGVRGRSEYSAMMRSRCLVEYERFSGAVSLPRHVHCALPGAIGRGVDGGSLEGRKTGGRYSHEGTIRTRVPFARRS